MTFHNDHEKCEIHILVSCPNRQVPIIQVANFIGFSAIGVVSNIYGNDRAIERFSVTESINAWSLSAPGRDRNVTVVVPGSSSRIKLPKTLGIASKAITTSTMAQDCN